ncbi:uncharacterized protein PGTG_14510 [Puccinia graminis f. sp. tritici CRL 75-36-700-3]|uniref:Uncharacterized protein n=1 Tax=Puccinia graminis f. sp. tritici (strain CRL 75-36-700-3 / race SCCL) TaxID=418459 RepID=E3KU20_PUCGT|nr:uncharacterized protein PGTG_14510 [Puccinia graminis f. sp. tritici CRL 75-36-700-3]EFP87795.2 hypothetical protein PGTG_14510 [Puccinia graminis f. sp. tritici CRL 75-36-700-3]
MASKNHRSIISAPIIHVGLVPWSNKEQIAQARQTSITNDQRLIIQAYVCRTENRQAYGGRKAERLAHTEKGMPACYETASCLGSWQAIIGWKADKPSDGKPAVSIIMTSVHPDAKLVDAELHEGSQEPTSGGGGGTQWDCPTGDSIALISSGSSLKNCLVSYLQHFLVSKRYDT